MKKSKKPKQPRNWHAVNAHLRSGAGAMKDKREALDKKELLKELTQFTEGLDDHTDQEISSKDGDDSDELC